MFTDSRRENFALYTICSFVWTGGGALAMWLLGLAIQSTESYERCESSNNAYGCIPSYCSDEKKSPCDNSSPYNQTMIDQLYPKPDYDDRVFYGVIGLFVVGLIATHCCIKKREEIASSGHRPFQFLRLGQTNPGRAETYRPTP
jgi:hypothetical protein